MPILIGLVLVEGVALALVLLAGPDRGVVVSAFLGALFPFLFIIVWEYSRRFTSRKVKGHNALVEVELVSNGIMAVAGDNLALLNYALERRGKPIHEGVPMLEFREMREFPFRLILDFLSSRLVNNAFSLNVDIGTINSDARKFERQFRESMLPVIGKPASVAQNPDFLKKYDGFFGVMEMLKNAYLGVLEGSLEVGAEARVVRRDAESRFSIARFLKSPDDVAQKEKVIAEIEVFREEIRKTMNRPTVCDIGKASRLEDWISRPPEGFEESSD